MSAGNQPLDAALAARRADRAFMQRLARRVAEEVRLNRKPAKEMNT